MKGGNPKLVAMLRYTDKDKALEEICDAINTAEGDIRIAAKALRIGKRTLFRWCAEYSTLSNCLRKARQKRAEA